MAMRSRGADHQSEERSERRETPSTEVVTGLLNRADIVLTRGGGVASAVIRRFTRSYWNHAAVIFVLSDLASKSHQGYQRTFILEAESHGVDIHPVDKYLRNENQDMMILRFPSSSLPSDRRVDFLRRVRGFALEEIDAVYGYGTILRIAERILGPVGWSLRPIIRAAKVTARFNREKAINDFVCSGVVQYAYYRACYGEDPAMGELWDRFFESGENRRRIIVNRKMRAALDPQASFGRVAEQLKLTTPADFSRAARDSILECLAERVNGVWQTEPTKE